MKTPTFILTVCVLAILASCTKKPIEKGQTVNAVIGDISFLESFGSLPTKETSEKLRIQTHLSYVETLLRSRDVSALTKEKQANRLRMLDLLNEYWTAGVFPTNYDYPNQRIPCFIDMEGRICAVGYLIEQTFGRQIAEKINAKFKYEYVLAMNDPVIDGWIESSGLTKGECAMIQPNYRSENYISPAFGISSSLMSGMNLSLNAINAIQIAQGADKKTVPVVGLIAGAGQLTLGALHYSEEPAGVITLSVNERRRNLAYLNIGFGVSTMIMSSWNLITNRKPKEKSVSWNMYSFPAPNNNMGLGFSLTKRL